MKLTVENVMNEEKPVVPVKPAKKQKPVKAPDKAPESSDEVPELSKGKKVFITTIFTLGMILFAFMAYMVISNLNLTGDKAGGTVDTKKEVVATEETVVDDSTPKDEQIKKLTDENTELKAQLEAEKQRSANGTNYDETIEELKKELEDAKTALSASEAREKALQEQLGGTTGGTSDKQ